MNYFNVQTIVMKFLLSIFFCLVTALAFAQSKIGKISGTVTDSLNKGLDGATVSLLRSKDGRLVKVAVSDKDGFFEYEKIPEGDYVISVTSTGFRKKNIDKIIITTEKNSVQVNPIVLSIAAGSLKEVTVTGRPPLIENKIDRTVVNVDAAPTNAGATALEVLEKSPGVSVDNDGNISLKGKQGVIVMMDGKPSYLSAADLSNVLRNMPASALDQIEIMTNPPARYDASGNSGIINIKTKKSRNEGLNGSFTTGGTISLYKRNNVWLTPVRSSQSVNLNYRKGRVNLFGNLNYNYNENKGEAIITRKLFEKSGNLDVTSIQNTTFNGRNNNYTLKLGLDFYQNKKTTWGIVMNGFTFAGRPRNVGAQTFRRPDGSVESLLSSNSFTKADFSNYSGNVNYKHRFDSIGKEITVDIDYVGYTRHNKSILLTDSYDAPGGMNTSHSELRGNIPGTINIYSLKSDFTNPINKNVRFDAGIKMSYVANDNEIAYTRLAGNDWVKDSRTNHFIYKELINAGYVSINRQWKKFSAQTGIRVENTIAKGRQVINDSPFTRNYLGIFPTVYLNYLLNKSHTITFSYGRRINRPNYQDLNPFVWFLDSLTYRQGNPYLLPEYAQNFELRHAYKSGITTVLNYSVTEDVISQILNQNERTTFLMPDNVSRLENIGLAITIPAKVNKWWNSNVFFNLFNNHFTGIYFNPGTNKNDPIDVQYTSYMLNVTNTFNFKKGWSGELSGWYRGRTVEQLAIADAMYFLTAGVQKNVMKGKGTLRLNLRDPFHIQKYSAYTKYSNIDVRIYNRWNNRSLTVTFSYRFGKSTVQQARRRTTGTNEEESRVGSQ
jgi:iron complex outermembrane recepter protein